MNVPELDKWIADHIQGGFGTGDMEVLKEEIEKLEPGEVYLEVGVDEGRSFTTARHYAKDGVWIIGVDMIDPPARAPYMNMPFGYSPNGQGFMVPDSHCIYIHGDANMVAQLWDRPIGLLFIDGDHSYEGVKKDTLSWEPKVKPGGTIFFHDYDSPGVKEWLDEHYGDNKEIVNGNRVRVRK